MKKRLTIFTPTYNRAYILPNLYKSLLRQTNKDFEWLVVDDGSTDNTYELVNQWKNEGFIEIRYIYQENSGKMKAHNCGVLHTHTELFFCLDSDDYIVEMAVEIILNQWDKLSFEEKKPLAGMVGYKGTSPENPIGKEFPINVKCDTLGGFYKKGLSGDTSLIFRTDVIAEYPFPIISNEKFITEAYVYDQIDRDYCFYAVPRVLTVCEYREDGLSKNLLKVTFRNPCGYVAYNIQKGNFSNTLKERFLYYVRATAFFRFTDKVELPVLPSHKTLYVLSYPFGILFFLYKRKKYIDVLKEEEK